MATNSTHTWHQVLESHQGNNREKKGEGDTRKAERALKDGRDLQ